MDKMNKILEAHPHFWLEDNIKIFSVYIQTVLTFDQSIKNNTKIFQIWNEGIFEKKTVLLLMMFN